MANVFNPLRNAMVTMTVGTGLMKKIVKVNSIISPIFQWLFVGIKVFTKIFLFPFQNQIVDSKYIFFFRNLRRQIP